MTRYYRKDGNGLIFKVEDGGKVFYFNKKERKWKDANMSAIEFCWNGIEYEDLTEEDVKILLWTS